MLHQLMSLEPLEKGSSYISLLSHQGHKNQLNILTSKKNYTELKMHFRWYYKSFKCLIKLYAFFMTYMNIKASYFGCLLLGNKSHHGIEL